jgi:hypothetical protein
MHRLETTVNMIEQHKGIRAVKEKFRNGIKPRTAIVNLSKTVWHRASNYPWTLYSIVRAHHHRPLSDLQATTPETA